MTNNGIHYFLVLFLVSVNLMTITVGDDAKVMRKLGKTLFNTPRTWSRNNCCKWEGITCDISNVVTAINIHSKSVAGTLTPEINQLSQLKTLAIHNNSISGDLPSLDNLLQLEYINLESNNFSSIPSDFFVGLDGLQTFSINDNRHLAYWVLPETLGENNNLLSFQASNAKIVGVIPNVFDKLLNLKHLRLSHNNLTGTISPTFGSSTSLRSLALNDNNLVGSIPEILKRLPNLESLDVSNNNLSGIVPNFSDRVNFTISGNPLFGEVEPGQTHEPWGSGDQGSSEARSGVSNRNQNPTGLILGVVVAVIVVVVLAWFLYYMIYIRRCIN